MRTRTITRLLLAFLLLLPLTAGRTQNQDATTWPHVLHLPGDPANIYQAWVANGNGGTWTATVNGHTTAALPYNVTSAALQSALAGLTGIGAGKVQVYGPTGGPWTIIFNPSLTISSTSADSTGLTSNTTAGGFVPAAAFALSAGAHVDHGLFWPQTAGTDIGNVFYYQSWYKTLSIAGYLLSAGYGGNHEALWSGNAGTGQYFQCWNGTTALEFSDTYFPVLNEWGFRAVGCDGAHLFTFYNGICTGIFAFTGSRKAVGFSTGGGTLFIGGSTHICATGDLAWLEFWDRAFYGTSGVPSAAQLPLRYPRVYDGAMGAADFAADYTHPAATVPDLAPTGYQAVANTFPGVRHPGILTSDVLYSDFAGGTPLTAPSDFYVGNTAGGYKPYWIVDASCPFGRDIASTPLPKERTYTPATPLAGTTVFDSFQRRNQTPAFQQHPTLGRTEAGSIGSQPWITATPDSFGLLGGQACITREHPTIAWVAGATADGNQEVTVERDGPYTAAGPYNGQTGLCARVVDDNNHWEAIVPPGTNVVYVYPVVAGVADIGGTFAWDPANDTTFMYLRLTCNGTSIQAHTSVNGSTWVDGPVWTDSRVPSGTGAGLSSGYWQSSTYGKNSRQRFLMFSVRQL